MKIKLTNEIESVCGRFILPVNCELDGNRYRRTARRV